MSSGFLALDSTHRNRIQFPDPAYFEATINNASSNGSQLTPNTIEVGTSRVGSTSTVIALSNISTSYLAGGYVNAQLTLTSRAGISQSRLITVYDNVARTATVLSGFTFPSTENLSYNIQRFIPPMVTDPVLGAFPYETGTTGGASNRNGYYPPCYIL